MHNNIMAAGSKDRPPMLGPGRYSQWRSQTSVVIEVVAATVNAPAVPEHDEAETVHNMSEENKLYFKAEKEAIFLLLTGIGDEIYSTVDACNTANEMWTAIERLQQGESLNIQDVKTNLFWEFGKFTSRDGESMESYYSRFYKLMMECKNNVQKFKTMQVNVQFLQQLQLRMVKICDGCQAIKEDIKAKRSPNQLHSSEVSILKKKVILNMLSKRDKEYANEFGTLQLFQEALQTYQQQPSNFWQTQEQDEVTTPSGTRCSRQADWLADTDEEIDEQELEAHYSFMVKIQEVLPEESSSTDQPLEHCQKLALMRLVVAPGEGMAEYFEYVESLEERIDERDLKTDLIFKHIRSTSRREREQYHEIQDLKAQMQDKNIAISELKKLIEKCKGKSVETQFDKPSVVRQPNAQRILKPSVLGKPTPFSNSPEMRSFQTKQSVNKTNVSDGSSKQVTQQNLPQNRKQAEIHTNTLTPGMYRIATSTTQNREPQLPHASRNTNPHVSTSTGVNHSTSVSRPPLKSYQVKDKVVPNNSQVKFTKKEVEDHHRISKIHEDFEYVKSLENEVDELESKKADFSNKKTTTVPEKTMNPRSCLRWQLTGRILKTIGLRWVPTGKLFNSYMGKVDSEPTHGSIVDIPHIHACKQTLGLSA
ncbi:hypothetical protein Tco_0839841, partial [Tanacetum coccineum]